MPSPIPEILDDLRQGKMIILADDEKRENEGDLVFPAQMASAEAVNFMATHARGLICVVLAPARLRELQLPPMTHDNTSRFGTAFHLSFEAASGVTTGISAHDRARSIRVAADPASRAEDLARPGHMFPLSARPGGVLERSGQTEGSMDLMRMAGLQPAAALCEIMNEDGTMARMPALKRFSAEHGIKICTVADLIHYRRVHEKLVFNAAETRLPTEFGDFRLVAYETSLDSNTHLALIKGELNPEESTLVRLHSECLTGDVLGSLRCDCGSQLRRALRLIAEEGQGVLVYLRQEGRGIGLLNKIRAYALQDQGMDTVEANVHLGFDPDPRDYSIGAQILCDLGVRRMRLLTNNPLKEASMEAYGLEITGRTPLHVPANDTNRQYLETKREKLGHLIP